MSLGSLFPGMEAYLDGNVEINNNIGTPGSNTADEELDTAAQATEVAENTDAAVADAKDTEEKVQMLTRMLDAYDYAKRYGVNKSFLTTYNRYGELDHICGIKFPSCESFSASSDPYSRYSAAFITAMEDQNESLWEKIKRIVKSIWDWIAGKAKKIWGKILELLGLKKGELEKAIAVAKKCDPNAAVTFTGAAAVLLSDMSATNNYINEMKSLNDRLNKAIGPVQEIVNEAVSVAEQLSNDEQPENPKEFMIRIRDGLNKFENDEECGIVFINRNYYGNTGFISHIASKVHNAFNGRNMSNSSSKAVNAAEENDTEITLKMGEAVKVAESLDKITNGLDKSLDAASKSLEKIVEQLASTVPAFDKVRGGFFNKFKKVSYNTVFSAITKALSDTKTLSTSVMKTSVDFGNALQKVTTELNDNAKAIRDKR